MIVFVHWVRSVVQYIHNYITLKVYFPPLKFVVGTGQENVKCYNLIGLNTLFHSCPTCFRKSEQNSTFIGTAGQENKNTKGVISKRINQIQEITLPCSDDDLSEWKSTLKVKLCLKLVSMIKKN